MSYIRSTSIYQYVDAESPGDYIYWCSAEREEDEFIEDYGRISDTTLVEFLVKVLKEGWSQDEKLFIEYLCNKVAERLEVPLRNRKLTDDEAIQMLTENHKKWLKENKEWVDKLVGGENARKG